MRQHVRSDGPVSLEDWQCMLTNVDPDTTFHDHATVIESLVETPDKLQATLNDFGTRVLAASFAIRHGVVEGAWIDLHHNYIVFIFSKATGDEEDFVMINSFTRRADT
jgi:hypothetical protein